MHDPKRRYRKDALPHKVGYGDTSWLGAIWPKVVRSMLQYRLDDVLRAAVLLCLVPMVAVAEENPGWHGEKWEDGATLFYGIPQTDYAPVSLSCPQGGAELVFAFTFEPVNAAEGAETTVLLQAGDIEVPIVTTGTRIEMDDSFILEGRTVLDQRLTDLITSRGTLIVSVEDGTEEFPLDGSREAAAALIETCASKAASVPPSETTQCNLAAWIMKDAPADLAVRAGPGPDYPVVATVPRPYSDGEEIYFPEVKITGSRDGWFRIGEIVTDLYGGLTTDPITTFSGEGWLPGNVLRLWVESGHLWSQPSSGAPVTFTFGEVESGSDYFRVDALHACEGFWIEVGGAYSGKQVRGWTGDTCASQVTTCP